MRPDILLSEGSSLSSREAVTALGLSGLRVDVCAPTRWALSGFSRWVRRVRVTPAVGVDPSGYSHAVSELCRAQRYDVLLPVHEQAYLFAALRERDASWPTPSTAVPVAAFGAFEALQTKTALASTLAMARLRQAVTLIARSRHELFEHGQTLLKDFGGCVVKATTGTASTGVQLVRDLRHLRAVCQAPGGEPESNKSQPFVVQQLVEGPLERVQAIFADGRLLAVHCYRQLLEGPGGGDVLKESVRRPAVIGHMQALGAALRWHGALSFDYLVPADDPAPTYIDANPRLVEPMNAYLSGVDLASLLVRVAMGEAPAGLTIGAAGVRTRLGVPGMLERARAAGRRAVLADVAAQVTGTGRYAATREELTPVRDDPPSVIPFLKVALTLLASPSRGAQLTTHTIDQYALGERGFAFARRTARPGEGSGSASAG